MITSERRSLEEVLITNVKKVSKYLLDHTNIDSVFMGLCDVKATNTG